MDLKIWQFLFLKLSIKLLLKQVKFELIFTAEMVVFPPAIYVSDCASLFKTAAVGVQNVHSEKSGAFTGEISNDMVLDLGLKWVIIGHSEVGRNS